MSSENFNNLLHLSSKNLNHLLYLSTFSQFPAFIFEALFFASLLVVFSFWLYPGGLAWAFSKSKTVANAIPGPSGFPLIELLHVSTLSSPHKVLVNFDRSYKVEPLMAFLVWLTRFVISSHPDVAKEVLSNAAFAYRPMKESAYELLFHRAMGFAPYGEYWRNLRWISATYMFSPKRIAASESLRCDTCLTKMHEIRSSMITNGEVRVKELLHFASHKNVMMSIFGRSYELHAEGEGMELEKLVSEGYELLGIFNWSDHFPLSGWLDLQGVRRRCRCLASKVVVFRQV